jgi:hypothetical protein
MSGRGENMLKLTIRNDGKKKHQSFEAWVEGVDCDRGYGWTEQEATDEYKRELKELSKDLNEKFEHLYTCRFETKVVDFRGKEIT